MMDNQEARRITVIEQTMFRRGAQCEASPRGVRSRCLTLSLRDSAGVHSTRDATQWTPLRKIVY